MQGEENKNHKEGGQSFSASSEIDTKYVNKAEVNRNNHIQSMLTAALQKRQTKLVLT